VDIGNFVRIQAPRRKPRIEKNGPLSSLQTRCPKEKNAIQIQQIRVNGRIRAKEVRVIVAATNEQLGVLKLQDALRKAQGLGLDLVEVAPNANPPVCRIVDFGKFRYELAKQEKDKKQNTSKLKEIKFRVNIDEHDYLTKIRRGEQFLDKGNKLKVQLQFRGREMAHKELGDAVMRRVKEDLSTMAAVEMEPKQVGKSINMTLSPLPAAKRKRRFSAAENDVEEDDHDDDRDEHEDDED
jgi:translation initiation factor IF-3